LPLSELSFKNALSKRDIHVRRSEKMFSFKAMKFAILRRLAFAAYDACWWH